MNQAVASFSHCHTVGMNQSQMSSILLVLNLNDRGATLLTKGDHDGALELLVQALRLWEQVASDVTCQCGSCAIEECIVRSIPATSLQQQQAAWKSAPCSGDVFCESESEGEFIYKRPIFASPKFAQGHPPGVTLSLIIILNLAMAHHQCAISHNNCRHRLQKSLQLYELAHVLLVDEEVYSPRASMIIANNVGMIHKAVKNASKHLMCLQHLLSTLMYVIDIQTSISSTELEGFFRNTSQLILHNNCAGAA